MSVYITNINTAVPDFEVDRERATEVLSQVMHLNEEEKKKFKVLVRATGIHTRYTVIDDYIKVASERSFFHPESPPDTALRMQKYMEELPQLAVKAAAPIVEKENPPTHIIAVSCTGVYAPGLDIELVESLGLPKNTTRLGINFMGCYAAITAMRQARYIVQAQPEAKVLIVSVELCSLHTQASNKEDDLLSASLFGDGAAAVMVEGHPGPGISIEIVDDYSEFFPSGMQDMAWSVGNFGFEMRLSTYVPDIIQSGIAQLVNQLLQQVRISMEQIRQFAIHPGGKRILEVIEKTLNIPSSKNKAAWHVLKNYGNMSSPTYLFVLKQLMNSLRPENNGEYMLGLAFGPGLTLESNLLKVHAA